VVEHEHRQLSLGQRIVLAGKTAFVFLRSLFFCYISDQFRQLYEISVISFNGFAPMRLWQQQANRARIVYCDKKTENMQPYSLYCGPGFLFPFCFLRFDSFDDCVVSAAQHAGKIRSLVFRGTR